MAAAETKKMDKQGSVGLPGFLGWGPRKYGELKTFFTEVRSELKKVTWPGRDEVYSTTIVVIVTTIFFGIYLHVMDLGFSWILSLILKR